MRRLAIIVAASVILCGMPAQAALVTNGSFEDPDLASGTNDISDATTHVWNGGWTSSDNGKSGYGAGVEDRDTSPWPGQTGDQYGKMKFVSSSSNQWMKIFRTEGAVLADATYTYEVDATWQKAWASGSQPSWGGYNEVQFLLSGNLFERHLGALPEKSFALRSIEVVIAPDGTLLSTDADVAPPVGTLLTGGNVELRLMGGRQANTGEGGDSYLAFDNVRLTVLVPEPPIPEPAGLGLLGVALLAMRKRRA